MSLNKHILPLGQKGVGHLLLLILLVLGIGIGIYLVQNPAIFKPKASENTSANYDYNFADEWAIATLQNWYNPNKGLWENPGSDSWRDPYWWDSANALEAVERSIIRTNGEEYQNIISNTYDKNINGSVANPSPNFINDFHDDEQWWALAWIRAYDITGDSRYLDTAKTIASDVAHQWTDSCGGGIKWRKSDDYKAADQNLLFILLTLRLHQRTPGDTQYLGWAQNTWNWFKSSGMINGNNHINNGLDKITCQNDGGVVWSYNMGNAIAAMLEFYRITGDTAYLTQAETFTDASLSYLVDDKGVLEDQCQKAYWINAGYDSCDKIDTANFKGVFIRNLISLYNTSHKDVYYDFIAKNANSNWSQNRNAYHQYGLNWSGPFDKADVPRQTAASFNFSSLAIPYTKAMPFIRGSADKSFRHELGAQTQNLSWKCSNALCNRQGIMQSGPYAVYKALIGNHTVHYRLKVSQTSPLSSAIATLIVKKDGQTIAEKNVLASDFTESNKSQNFDLSYSNPNYGDSIEFQVVWNNIANSPDLTIEDISIDGQINLSAANLNSETGKLDAYNNRYASPASQDQSGFLTTGPGIKLPSGNHTAQFELKVDNFNLDNSKIATLSVIDTDTNQTVSTQDISRNSFTNTLFKIFPLSFNSIGNHYDFQVFYHASPTGPILTQRGVYIQSQSTQNPSGQISASPNPCIISPGQSTCSSNISWSIPNPQNIVQVRIRESGGLFGQAPSGTQTAPWIGQIPVHFDLYDGENLLSTVLVKSTSPANQPSPSPITNTGILRASPNPCTITTGTSCTSTISWSAPNLNDLKITIKENPGSLFAAGASGTSNAPWISENGATFEAYSEGRLVDSIFVKGIPQGGVSNTRIISASPNPCTITSGETCTSTITWNSNYDDLKITIKENPGSLFASGASGSQAAPWIGVSGATFEAYSNGSLVDSLRVKGQR